MLKVTDCANGVIMFLWECNYRSVPSTYKYRFWRKYQIVGPELQIPYNYTPTSLIQANYTPQKSAALFSLSPYPSQFSHVS